MKTHLEVLKSANAQNAICDLNEGVVKGEKTKGRENPSGIKW